MRTYFCNFGLLLSILLVLTVNVSKTQAQNVNLQSSLEVNKLSSNASVKLEYQTKKLSLKAQADIRSIFGSSYKVVFKDNGTFRVLPATKASLRNVKLAVINAGLPVDQASAWVINYENFNIVYKSGAISSDILSASRISRLNAVLNTKIPLKTSIQAPTNVRFNDQFVR